MVLRDYSICDSIEGNNLWHPSANISNSSSFYKTAVLNWAYKTMFYKMRRVWMICSGSNEQQRSDSLRLGVPVQPLDQEEGNDLESQANENLCEDWKEERTWDQAGGGPAGHELLPCRVQTHWEGERKIINTHCIQMIQ